MGKNNKNDGSAQGAKIVTEQDFGKMIARDLQTAAGLLHAVLSDQNILNSLSEFMYGRYLNALHKADLEKETKIES